YPRRRARLVNLTVVLETPTIAGLDSHGPLRVPASQFLFGQDLGLDVAKDATEPLPPELADRPLALTSKLP
ncbi:MAG: hypothetical protein ACR2HD_03240, partial [Solirubrobacteraceae bacterium]